DHRRFLVEEFPSLVLDATTKAEDLAFKTRIARIAQILASAAEAGPSRSADYTEEMMRVAMALSDADVMVLAEVDNVQAKEIAPTGYVPNELVNDAWRDSPPEVSGLNDGQIQSICAKLQSFGLVTRVDRNPSKLFHTT